MIVETTQPSCFHRAIKSVLITAQCFGLLPVYGVTEPDVNRLRFKWFSLKTIYCMLAIVGLVFALMLLVLKYFRDNQFGVVVAVVFISLQTLGYLLFLKLARNWHAFSREWQDVDITMYKYNYQPNLQRRFKVTMAVLLGMALLEHLLYVFKTVRIAENCPNFQTDPLRAYSGIDFSSLYTVTSYAPWKTILIELTSILGTFQWNFLDLFLVLLSSALAERFKQINKAVIHTQIENESFWRQIREDYTKLWTMCQTINNNVCHLVSLSFGGNLFFICWQMFNSFKPITGTVQTIYFCYSFGYLVGRTLVVSMYCCWINDEGKEVLASLFNLASQYYGPEANRLIQQICGAPPALSGSNCFLVTRDLCLQVASAVIAFELVLLQIGPSYLKTDKHGPLFCLAEEESI